MERGCIIPLQAVYDHAETQVNFLQPVLKLREKVRDGAKITKRYDTARTPYRRLLETNVPDLDARIRLDQHSAGIHPVRLKLAIEIAQKALSDRAVREGSVMSQRMTLEKI